ncbi:ATP-binding protein [Hydrogenophaga sp.]|uniref:ATP-binding protein n=1 Tax=Hydrogenophaga sp. TaxID=1904254 RepID=UPI002608CAD1|nr:ATP-binding protein [Hydrogenophaga sp.]
MKVNPCKSLFRRPHSIRTLLFLLVLAILFPALLVALWVVGLNQKIARETNERLLEDTARALAMVLDLEIAKRSAMVRALALSRMLDSAPAVAPQTLRAFDDQARRTLTGLEGWLEVRASNRLLVNTRLPPGVMPRAELDPRRGSLADKTQILPLVKNEDLGIYYATLVQPVLRNGVPVLNLTLTMLPHEFQRIIDQQDLEEDWIAAILDSQGRVVARHPGGAAYAGRYATDDLRARLAQASSGLVHSRTLDGHASTIYYSTSPKGWTYVTGMPRDRFEGVVPDDLRTFSLGTLILLALAVLAALGASHRIVRSIQFLKHQAQGMHSSAPVHASTTGITECDEVAKVMASARQSINGAQSEMLLRVEQAVAQTRHAEERMAHSQRLEALGRLTGGVAHDFNNLLGVISNSGHLMLRKTQDPQITASVEVTLRAVETGSRLTQHLLRFAGRQSVQPCTISLTLFLPEVAELIRSLMGRHIQLTVVLDPLAPSVFVDPNELELALINLALNAREAIAERGHVELRAAPAERDDCTDLPQQDYVMISVTDDGRGIAEGIVDRVFEPFFSTKGPVQGTGLGLSQVYGFCVQSRGTVRLNSTVGLGTSVTMVLPARYDGEAVPAVALESLPSIAGTRVLQVEDNEELSNVTAALLMSFGCEVVNCSRAEDALQMLEKEVGVDLLLSDVLMPGPLNGVALARLARQQRPELAIVLISGHRGDVGDDNEFPFVQKPSTPEKLVRALHQALSVRSRAS